MECFADVGRPAVGSCKFCGKGLCRECARDEDLGLVCSDACLRQMATIRYVNAMTFKMYGVGPKSQLQSISFLVCVIAVFGLIGYGFYRVQIIDAFSATDISIVIVFTAIFLIGLRLYWRMRS